MQSNNDGPMKRTLLSTLESIQSSDNFPRNAVHPFASNASKTSNFLQDLINATEQISTSLRLYEASAQWTNPKLISFLRQHTAIEHTSFTVENGVRHLVDALRVRSGVHYGETLPLNANDVPNWCIQQLVAWGTSLGMEAFQGDETQGGSMVVMGGKVLVIDVDFAIHRDRKGATGSASARPTLEVVNVKTSNALAGHNSSSNSGGTSAPLDSFLLDGIREYCAEMQKEEDERASQRAAALRRRMVEHLQYLVLLDRLASHKDSGGIRWFTDVDELYPVLLELARSEAQSVAVSFSSPIAPVDVFLLRCHSLPIPYLLIPSISFLVHVSPSAYLHLIRKSTGQKQPATQMTLPLDISLADIKQSVVTIPNGVTIATLYLQERSGSGLHHLYPSSITIPNATSRPTFPLSASGSDFDHIFPQINSYGASANPPGLSSTSQSAEAYVWMLDFTQGGRRRGVVMSQSRMKAIELIVNPLAVGNDLGCAAGVGSWIDLLLNPENPMAFERYTSLYQSPNSLHPPLQLRLAAPEEPGYILDSVPIHSMKEIWGILEIVREQCWLNETVLSCNWIPETLKTNEEELPDGVPVTEDGLQAVLTGTFAPRKIPVNVLIPSGHEADDLFGTDLDFLTGSRPKVVMTCPERAPISGHIEITIGYDEKKARGVSVTIQGAVGLDINWGELEEVCRRGGIWGLPGKIWTS